VLDYLEDRVRWAVNLDSPPKITVVDADLLILLRLLKEGIDIFRLSASLSTCRLHRRSAQTRNQFLASFPSSECQLEEYAFRAFSR